MGLLGGKVEDGMDGVVGVESLRPYNEQCDDLEMIVRVGDFGFLLGIGA